MNIITILSIRCVVPHKCCQLMRKTTNQLRGDEKKAWMRINCLRRDCLELYNYLLVIISTDNIIVQAHVLCAHLLLRRCGNSRAAGISHETSAKDCQHPQFSWKQGEQRCNVNIMLNTCHCQNLRVVLTLLIRLIIGFLSDDVVPQSIFETSSVIL